MKRVFKAALISGLIAVSVQTECLAKAVSVTFPYEPEAECEVVTQMGFITDLQFHAGETIVYIGAGDTQRWMIDTANFSDVPHLFVKPTEENISTNLVVATNDKVYRLVLHSTNQYVPLVKWSYPLGSEKKVVQATQATQQIFGYKKYNYAYKVDNKKFKAWNPTKIYDDGTRTYIGIPKESKNDLPTIHILDGKKSNLVNYRVSDDGYFIVDRVFHKAILYFTANESITITNNNYKDVRGGK